MLDLAENEVRLLAYLATGIRTAAEIQHRFGLSQPTVSRMISRCGSRILALGNARRRRYACRREVLGTLEEFPIFKVDPEGNASPIGTLAPIGSEGYLWSVPSSPGEVFKSIPWFIDDLRPEGFVGRSFVRQLHQDLSLPPRGIDWRDDQVLWALARRGDDSMGNLIVGTESLDRYFQKARGPADSIRLEEIGEAYPRLAQTAMDGQPVGSSAGGEQPKFTALIEIEGTFLNVLVKFSLPISSVEGRRWADLLVCEHHALRIVQESGIPAVQSQIIEAGQRVFLEVERFDRVGRHGRLPIISLRAVDNEFYCKQDNWVSAANRMEKDGRLAPGEAVSLRWLSVFGDLIANTDQHFGNVSLVMADGRRLFNLAPAYDMLPMLYRPRDGVAPVPAFTPPAAAPGAPVEWGSALHWAVIFWERVAEDAGISKEFREVCARNSEVIRGLGSGPRLVVRST